MAAEADDLDRAADLTRRLEDAAIEEVRLAAAPQQVQCIDGSWPKTECDCGETIPAGRLRLGRIRCIDCQDALERGRRGYR